MAASLWVAGLVTQASSKTTARNCRTALEMVSRRQLTPNCSGGATVTRGRNSTPRTVNCPAADSAAKAIPSPPATATRLLQRGRLEHDRRRDTAAGQDVVHQVVVERRVERSREQDDRLVGEMPSLDGAQPGQRVQLGDGHVDGLAVQGPEGQVVAVGTGQAHEGHVQLDGRPGPRGARRPARPPYRGRLRGTARGRSGRPSSAPTPRQPWPDTLPSLVMPSPASRAAWTA